MTSSFIQRAFALASLAVAVAPAAAYAQGDATCGPAFVARRRLPATAMIIPTSNVSVRMPAGWRGEVVTGNDGHPVYRVQTPAAGAGGVALIQRPMGLLDRFRDLNAIADEAVAAFLGQQPARTIEARGFNLAGDCGTRRVLRTETAEVNVTLIRGGAWLYAVFASYPVASAGTMRAGIDTIVASAVLAPPPAAAPAAAAPAPKRARKDDCSRYSAWEDRMNCLGPPPGVDVIMNPVYQ